MAAPPTGSCPACATLQARAEQAEGQLAEVQAKLAEVQAKLDEVQAKLDEAQAKLDEAQAKLDEVQAKLDEAQAKLDEAQAKLAAIQKQRVSRKRRKRPTSPSPDWLLVEEVRSLLNLSVGDLAARLGLAYSTVLGKAQETPLSPGLREKLLALKSQHLASTPG